MPENTEICILQEKLFSTNVCQLFQLLDYLINNDFHIVLKN